jgi:hypothetical protein
MFCGMIARHARFRIALLLALVLPLQGLSAASACGSTHLAQSAAAAQSAAGHHCAPLPGIAQHHGCGSCCAVAVAVAPLRWVAPLLPRSEVSSITLLPPPAVILDRLDRPPRHSI